MATIKKLSSGSFQARIFIDRDSSGKQLFKYITRNTERECKAAAREYEQALYHKTVSNTPNMKVSAFMDKWINIVRPTLSSTTIYNYKIYVNHHFKPYFKNLKLEQVTDLHIKEYMALKLEYLSSTTVRKHFFTLKKIFYDALKGRSPCIDIKAPKTNDYRPKVPTEDEFNQIWTFFKDYNLEFEIIVLLAGWCGMRRGEIFALSSTDIENDLVNIDKALAMKEEGYDFEIKAPKSKKGIRKIISPDYLIGLINKLIKIKSLVHAPLFDMKPDYFSTRFRELRQQNNLPDIRFHDLRHFHATFLYKNNIPDQYAANRLGHDIIVLKKIYQHLGLEDKTECDNKIKEIFKQG